MGESGKSNPTHNLPLVVCECGEKILLVPDLDEMARSIDAHASMHEKKEINQETAAQEYCRIEELLSQKVLILIGKKIHNQDKNAH
jgi:hypothetical protein